MLALIAALAMSAVSTWHSANFHDDNPAHMAATHAHEKHESTDPSKAIHLAAHMVGQGVDLPAATASPKYSTSIDSGWPMILADIKPGFDPDSPLKPPRA